MCNLAQMLRLHLLDVILVFVHASAISQGDWVYFGTSYPQRDTNLIILFKASPLRHIRSSVVCSPFHTHHHRHGNSQLFTVLSVLLWLVSVVGESSYKKTEIALKIASFFPSSPVCARCTMHIIFGCDKDVAKDNPEEHGKDAEKIEIK